MADGARVVKVNLTPYLRGGQHRHRARRYRVAGLVSVNRDFFMEPPGWEMCQKFYLLGVYLPGKLTQSTRLNRLRPLYSPLSLAS